ncbi:MAG: hypothetical protein QW228_04950 [Candidatus Aenigmatarchaeota archaeon]
MENKLTLVRRFPNGRIETENIMPEIVRDLRDIGFRMSRKEEELLRRRDAFEAERRLRTGDPPCAVCGTWSDDWLCPTCRTRFPWMHPDLGGY